MKPELCFRYSTSWRALIPAFMLFVTSLAVAPEVAGAQSWSALSLVTSGTLHNTNCKARLSVKNVGQRNETVIFHEIRSSEYREVRSRRQSIAFAVDSFDMLFPSEDLALNRDAYVIYWNDSINAGQFKVDGSLVVSLSDAGKPEVAFQYLYLTPDGQFKRTVPMQPAKFTLEEQCADTGTSSNSTLVPVELDLTRQEMNRRWINILDGDSDTSQQIGKAAVITLDLGQERAISTLKIIQGNDGKSAPISAITVSTSTDNATFTELSLSDGDKNPTARSGSKIIKLNAAGRYLRVQFLGKNNKPVTIRDLIVTALEGL